MSNEGLPPSLIGVELVFSSETNATNSGLIEKQKIKKFIVTKKVQWTLQQVIQGHSKMCVTTWAGESVSDCLCNVVAALYHDPAPPSFLQKAAEPAIT